MKLHPLSHRLPPSLCLMAFGGLFDRRVCYFAGEEFAVSHHRLIHRFCGGDSRQPLVRRPSSRVAAAQQLMLSWTLSLVVSMLSSDYGYKPVHQ